MTEGQSTPVRLLGVEAGGTSTIDVMEEWDGNGRREVIAGPANLRLLTDSQLSRHFRTIANGLPRPDAVAIGMAGARTEVDRERIRRAAVKVWPGVPCYATNDLETALIAADDAVTAVYDRRRKRRSKNAPTVNVLVLSGTGSCCFGRTCDGQTAKVGGWGHILGDKGSGFEIGLRALKAVVYYYDCDGVWSNAIVTPLKRESVWGAVQLARRHFQTGRARVPASHDSLSTPRDPAAKPGPSRYGEPFFPSLESLRLSPTEQRNPRSMNLDRLSIAEAIVLMLSEDERIPPAILAERKKIEQAVKLILRALKRGGRLFYIGAGTSGRLGVLDASECPPTFRAPPGLVQGIIAGGQRALWESTESAEDDPVAGAQAIQFRGVNRKDVVVGIAASGRTPFVWGALHAAKQRGAKTILLCFNPHLEISRRNRPDLVIAPDVGPEILTGSTRLKSGTATKLILNIFTTLAMVQLGKVVSNLMVDVNPSNVKLRNRAVRIVCELTGVEEVTAKATLEKSGWVVKQALRRLRPSA